jgi:hypothetical protein
VAVRRHGPGGARCGTLWGVLTPSSHPSASTPRAARGTATVAVVAAAALGLAGCGATDQPATPRTTTVTVTPSVTPSGSSTASTSSTTTTAADRPPTTYDEASRLFAAAKVDANAPKVFTSPTGNIFCSIGTNGDVPAGCEVKDGRIAAPPDVCPTGDAGAKDIGRIEWSGDAPKPICNTDTIYQVGAVVLQYGTIAVTPGSPYQCLSKEFGMTCIDTASKKGFFLARNTYVTF